MNDTVRLFVMVKPYHNRRTGGTTILSSSRISGHDSPIPTCASPSPFPSPWGRGNRCRHPVQVTERVPLSPTSGLRQNRTEDHPETSALNPIGEGFSLSPRERAGVRGNRPDAFPRASRNFAMNLILRPAARGTRVIQGKPRFAAQPTGPTGPGRSAGRHSPPSGR